MAIENISALEKAIGLDEGKLSEMMSSEDSHSLELDNLIINTKDNHNDLVSNIKKNSYEIGRKDLFKELTPDFEGTGAHKDVQRSIDFLKNWNQTNIDNALNEAQVEPEKRYNDLKSDFEKLQSNNSEWESKYRNLESSYKQKEQSRTINSTLLNAIPENTTIPKEDVLAIIKAKYDFNIGDDGFEILKDGEVLKNKTNLNLVTPEDFMKEFITPYLKSASGGAGGGNSKSGGNESSYEIFIKDMEDKNIKVGSESFNEEMSKAINNGTLKF